MQVMNDKAWLTEIAELRAVRQRAPEPTPRPAPVGEARIGDTTRRELEKSRMGKRLPWQGPVLVTVLGSS